MTCRVTAPTHLFNIIYKLIFACIIILTVHCIKLINKCTCTGKVTLLSGNSSSLSYTHLEYWMQLKKSQAGQHSTGSWWQGVLMARESKTCWCRWPCLREWRRLRHHRHTSWSSDTNPPPQPAPAPGWWLATASLWWWVCRMARQTLGVPSGLVGTSWKQGWSTRNKARQSANSEAWSQRHGCTTCGQ